MLSYNILLSYTINTDERRIDVVRKAYIRFVCIHKQANDTYTFFAYVYYPLLV
jgi:hypothetical protein